VQIEQVVHEVRITNQLLYLHPSMEEARYQIMQQFFAWQAIVTSQNKIQSTRYQVLLLHISSTSYLLC
jgi:dynein heavy chain 1